MARLDVVGLGPAGADLLTTATRELVRDVPAAYLRTTRHPAAEVLAGAPSGDHHYERHESFADVYAAIATEVLERTVAAGRLLYAVPGSPVVAEHTVELLCDRAGAAGVEVHLHPALSFVDLAVARLGVDPVAVRLCLVDAHRFAESVPSDGGAVLVAQCDSRFTLSDVKLAVDTPPAGPVVLLQRLGCPDESITEVAWEDIDRAVEADHLTTLWIPELPRGAGGRLDGLADLFGELRAGDAWKAAQDHHSLKRFLLEEAYEVIEAVDAYDPDTGEGAEELASELGDLLYQVVFHATLGAEAGWFDLADVVGAIHDKLERRHPHLGGESPPVERLVADWEAAKVGEQRRSSAFDGIPAELPALLRALKLVRKAEALGLGSLPGSDAVAAADPDGATDEATDGDPDWSADEATDRLLAAAVDLARAGRDPEDALRRRLAAIEAVLRSREP